METFMTGSQTCTTVINIDCHMVQHRHKQRNKACVIMACCQHCIRSPEYTVSPHSVFQAVTKFEAHFNSFQK